jgi:hypothetical protein
MSGRLATDLHLADCCQHDPLVDRTIPSSRLVYRWGLDYVHSDVRFAAIVAIRLGCYGLAVIGIIATLHIAFGG